MGKIVCKVGAPLVGARHHIHGYQSVGLQLGTHKERPYNVAPR